MNTDWLGSIVQWAVWGATMTLVMGWLARSRLKQRPPSAQGSLVQPVGMLVIGVVCFAFFAGIAIISNTIGKNSSTSMSTTLVFVGFALLGVPMIADYFFARHYVSDSGMNYGRTFGQRGFFHWSDVTRLQFSQSMKWFKIRLNSGVVVRVSAMLVGLPDFAGYVLRHVPREAVDDDAHLLLEEMRRGKLPTIWG
jgi:hypothetical protein